jgi:hypothetical protein
MSYMLMLCLYFPNALKIHACPNVLTNRGTYKISSVIVSFFVLKNSKLTEITNNSHQIHLWTNNEEITKHYTNVDEHWARANRYQPIIPSSL